MALILAAAAVFAPRAADALSFFPGRIVLDDRNRSAVLRIVNKENTARRYTITWRRMRMTADRGLGAVDDDDPADDLYPAREYVLFAPRQAVIPPKSTQAVRLLARVPADLPAGEYRSHLMVTEAPRAMDGGRDGQDLDMRIELVSRTTFPVIVLHGNPEMELSLESLEIRPRDGDPRLAVTLARSGNRSLYANAHVIWESPDGESHELFGPASLAIYRELERRHFDFPLKLPEGRTLGGGELRFIVRDNAADDGASSVLIDHGHRVP